MGAVIALEELGGGGDGWAAIGVLATMAAVVKDDVGGPPAALVAVDFADEVLGDLVGGGFLQSFVMAFQVTGIRPSWRASLST